MTDEAARLAARFEEYANDPASVSIPSRQECLDAATALRAQSLGTQEPVALLPKFLGSSSDPTNTRAVRAIFAEPLTAEHHHEIAMRLIASPPALVAQREALKAILRHATAPKRMASERLDNIEALARAALATPATGGETEREYDPNIEPCNDAEFGMKP